MQGITLIADRDKIFDYMLNDYIESFAAWITKAWITKRLVDSDVFWEAFSPVFDWQERVRGDVHFGLGPENDTDSARVELYLQQCSMYLEAFSDIANDNDEQYELFAKVMVRIFGMYTKRADAIQTMARNVREKRTRMRAARVIRRALWRCVQRRRQLELLDELYRPGGIGTMRAKRKFEEIVKTFDS
jgi:hypothetical protein